VARWMLPGTSSVGISEIHIQALQPQASNRFADGNGEAWTKVLQMHQSSLCFVQSKLLCQTANVLLRFCLLDNSWQVIGCMVAGATPSISLVRHATKSAWSGLYCCRPSYSYTRKSTRADLVAVVSCSCVHTSEEVAVKFVFHSDIPSLLCSGAHEFLFGPFRQNSLINFDH
jgi:hypothetical protein